MQHSLEQLCIPFNEHPWFIACPVIESFRWRPSAYHFQLFNGEGVEDPCFRGALPAYDAALFTGWPSLKQFERFRLTSEPPFSGLWVKFMRGDGGTVVEEVLERNHDR